MNYNYLCRSIFDVVECISGELCVSHIVRVSKRNYSNVFSHLSLLEKIGIIKKVKVTKYSYISLTKKGEKIQIHLKKIKALFKLQHSHKRSKQ